ncbi:hypothetical protein AA106556_1873 [Neokomagataea tanensis NBRC 106556]|uniref:Uncharacterized protein n=1 Tax=Neokomagataea tanensis NBRC 106556 TaxID=1223519 RepID=A0ABQ0QL40_9PROT|nr:hypothetical protein AA106556_1873 [Neokomagataea tanensis NBRC 106556]
MTHRMARRTERNDTSQTLTPGLVVIRPSFIGFDGMIWTLFAANMTTISRTRIGGTPNDIPIRLRQQGA